MEQFVKRCSCGKDAILPPQKVSGASYQLALQLLCTAMSVSLRFGGAKQVLHVASSIKIEVH